MFPAHYPLVHYLLRITLAYYQHADYNILGKKGCVLKMSLNLLWIGLYIKSESEFIMDRCTTKEAELWDYRTQNHKNMSI